MRMRNKIWRGSKNKHSRAGDIKILNPDGSLKQVVSIKTYHLKPQPAKQHAPSERETPEYITWRCNVLERDKHKCALCSSKEWIQAHHIERWIDNESLRFDPNNGVCLCIPCHTKHHGPQNKPFPQHITERLIAYVKTVIKQGN